MRQYILRIVFGILFLTLGFQSMALTDTTYRNAYEISKWLDIYNRNNNFSLNQKLNLLAALNFYIRSDSWDAEKTIPAKYKKIDDVRKSLMGGIVVYEKFFTKKLSFTTGLLNSTSNSIPGIRDGLINILTTYKNKQNELMDTAAKRSSNEEELKSNIEQIVTLNRKVNEAKVQIESIEKLLNDTAHASDTSSMRANRDRYLADQQKWSDSINTITQSNIHLNSEIDLLNKCELKLNAEIEKEHANGLSMLTTYSSSLQEFLFKLSEVPDHSEVKSMEAANEEYISTAQSNTQTIIRESELASSGSFHIPSQSELIDGLAIYLAGRIKQEAVLWFFDVLSKNIKSFDLMKEFFPNTCQLLQGREAYEIPNMGTQWRYALSKDFITMPRNVLASEWLNKKWKDNGKYASYIKGACDMAEYLMKHYSFSDAVKQLYLQKYQTMSGTLVFHDFISLLYIVNHELTIQDSNKGVRLLRYEDYSNMSKGALEFLLNLIDYRYGGTLTKFLHGMTSQISFSDSLKPEDLRKWLGNLQTVFTQIEKVRGEYVKDRSNIDETVKKLYTTNDIWQSFNQLWSLFDSDSYNVNMFSPEIESCKKAFIYVNKIQEIYGQVDNKNFSGAIQNTISLIDTFFYGTTDNKIVLSDSSNLRKYLLEQAGSPKILVNILKEIKKPDIKSKYGICEISDSSVTFKKNSQFAAIIFEKDRHAVGVIKKLGAFLNDVALTTSDKQLSKVVESYALGTGSYKRKRNNWWSLDLNAFAGIYGGYEWVLANKELNQRPKSARPVYGISVPIGLSLSKTFSRDIKDGESFGDEEYVKPDLIKLKEKRLKRMRNWTVTATISLIDPGAVVSYRLQNGSDTALSQNLKWSQIFSPGFHLATSIPNTPLVLSAGIVYAPQLRKFYDSAQVANPIDPKFNNNYNAFRCYIGIFFDLPLFNLWERKRIVYK